MSDDQSESGAKGTRGRKGKTPQDLDLAAADVREIASDAPAANESPVANAEAAPVESRPEAETPAPTSPDAPEASAETPVEPAAGSPSESPAGPAPLAAPASPSKALPAVIGLVAGLIGGIGGAVIAPKVVGPQMVGALGLAQNANTEANTALNERLAKAEAGLAAARTREDSLRSEIAALGSKITGEGETARKALESLEVRSARLAQPNPDIDTLKSRLGTLEGESKVLPKEVSVLGTKVETLQPKLDTLEKTLETLAGRMAAVGSKDALALANGRLAAQSLLEDEFGAGKPYASTLELLTRMGGEASLIALVRPFAEAGAPAPKTLLADFVALKPKAPPAPAGDTGLMDRAKKAALSLVQIRRTGDVAGKDDEAIFSRTEAALAKADLSAALAATAQLSPALAPAFAPWRTRLEARIKAGEAVKLLRRDAQSALARAAASAK